MKPYLTILTRPVPSLSPIALLKRRLKSLAKFKKLILGRSTDSYGGHPAVTRSLIEGLRDLKINFSYNPDSVNELGETVCVLSNISALQQAIDLKQSKTIKKLIAGPNLMVFSTEYNHILAENEIDICLVPSEWVKIAYLEDEPRLTGKVKVWYAGVDTEDWKPKNVNKDKSILVYWKTETKEFCEQIERKLKFYGWKISRLVYGNYQKEEYKCALEQCELALFISRSESQGLALAEAWSMNVPTLVWNPKQLTYNGRVYSTVSACPYLTRETGIEWSTLTDLDSILQWISQSFPELQPRKWVLENMSDVVATKFFLQVI